MMFSKELSQLSRQKILRQISDRSSSQTAVISLAGSRYLNFASNDYLGLASHKALTAAAIKSAPVYGWGAGSSRLLAGGTTLHRRLEQQVADFKGTEAALIFNSGYAANTGIIPAIAWEGDAVFSDELNHASIIDGCRLSRAEIHIYRHGDPEHLAALLKKHKTSGRRVVATDAVFSMDGDIAPLPELSELCRKHGMLLYLDDAHATGVLGGGRGSLAHFNMLPEPWILQMGTFSKALGSFGGFAAGSRELIDWLINRARSFIYSTALPAPVVAASAAALRILKNDRVRLRRLMNNRQLLFEGLQSLGLDTGRSESPVIPVMFASVEAALKASAELYKNRIYAPAIRPPTVAVPRLRLSVTAAHTSAQIEKLLEVLKKRVDETGGM